MGKCHGNKFVLFTMLFMILSSCFKILFIFNKFIYFIYFIFGCIGSLLLCSGFSLVAGGRATFHCGARASHLVASLVVEHGL